jgi:hypothetical protein
MFFSIKKEVKNNNLSFGLPTKIKIRSTEYGTGKSSLEISRVKSFGLKELKSALSRWTVTAQTWRVQRSAGLFSQILRGCHVRGF